jgi:hypothetical protein
MWTGTDGGKGWWVGRRVLLALLLGVAAGCGPGEAKAPIPLDERRAIEVIRRAMKDEGVDPDAGRDEPIANAGKPLHIDVGIKGHAYGIAYITSEDADALGAAIPSPNKPDEKLKLVRCGDGETHVVLLYQQNYRYDDLAGEVHEKTTITAESALARDVQDFITHARTQKYK